MNPQLILRFVLEAVALLFLFWFKWWLALVAIVLWGVFGVPDDPSRGKVFVQVPGWLRLLLELLIFGFAAFHMPYGWAFLIVVAVHYVTYDRTKWLLKH